jgi:hypothetical protein
MEETRFFGIVLLNLGQRTDTVNRREIELCQKAALLLGLSLQDNQFLICQELHTFQ